MLFLWDINRYDWFYLGYLSVYIYIYIIVSIAVIKLVSWKIIVIPVESITDRDLDGLLPASITKPISLSVASGFLRGCRMNGHKLWIINKKGIKIMLVYDGIWIWIWVKRFLQIITRVSVFFVVSRFETTPSHMDTCKAIDISWQKQPALGLLPCHLLWWRHSCWPVQLALWKNGPQIHWLIKFTHHISSHSPKSNGHKVVLCPFSDTHTESHRHTSYICWILLLAIQLPV